MPCNLIADASVWAQSHVPMLPTHADLKVVGSSLALVGTAEFGDKSQLVCMALAARHRRWPVLFGAVFAFALLNGIAVAFGATVAQWVPGWALAALVALLFAWFGLRALFTGSTHEEAVEEKSGHSIFVAAFLLIFLAEFGDKTQIAVAGLSTVSPPLPVWFGATLGLAGVSSVGVWAGHAVTNKLSYAVIHRIAGSLFLIFAMLAGLQATPPNGWEQIAVDLKMAIEGLLNR